MLDIIVAALIGSAMTIVVCVLAVVVLTAPFIFAAFERVDMSLVLELIEGWAPALLVAFVICFVIFIPVVIKHGPSFILP